jgi:hypothetical protein
MTSRGYPTRRYPIVRPGRICAGNSISFPPTGRSTTLFEDGGRFDSTGWRSSASTGRRLRFGHEGIRWLGGTTPAAHWDRRAEPREKTAERPRVQT